jgi:hypothetical protein
MSATLTPFFSPTQIPGCFLWMDAADSTTISLSGSNVTAWRDKSPSPIPLTLTGTPTYSSNAVRFTGSQNFVNSAISFNMATMTMFLVGYSAAGIVGSGGFVSLVPIANGVDWNQNNAITYNFDPTTLGQLYTTYNFNATGTNNVYLSSTNPILFCHVQNNTSYTLYGSGSNFATRTFSAPGVTTGISIGARYQSGNGTANHYYYGPMNEILLYSQALSDTQRQQIEGYLAWKWNVVSGLPANHPYKTTPVFSAGYPPFTIQRTSVPVPVFAPTQISGCQLWLDAADPTGTGTPPTNGTPVNTWVDKSGTAKNGVAGGTSVPTYSNQSIRYDGNGYYDTPYSAVPVNETLFVVFRWASITSAQGIISGLQLQQRICYVDPTISRWFYVGGIGAWGVWSTSALTSNVDYLGEFTWGSGSLAVSLYLNGSSLSTTSVNSPSVFSGTPTVSRVGGGFNGAMYEMIGYDSVLSTAQRQQVEGYLAWKWGLVSSLPNGHPYKTPPIAPFSYAVRQTVLSKFNPLSITGCSLWLDAADTSPSSLSLTGTTVNTWFDKSGNGNNSTSAIGSPQLNLNAVNGRSAVRTQPGKYFYFEPLATPANTTQVSAFAVATMNAAGNAFGRLVSFANTSNGTTNNDFSAVGNFIFCRDNLNAGMSVYRNSASIAMTVSYSTAFLMDVVFDGTTMNPFMNGSSNTVIASSGTFTFNRLGVGVNINTKENPVDVFDGLVCEVVLYYSALSTLQRQQVEGYLAWKWGLVGNLPGNHPFKLYPPPPQ